VLSTRDRLIDAAAALLDEGGPAAVTLREVGRLAGVSHNAPYKHFADKEDLLAAVAARELARPRPGGPGGRGSPGEDLRQMMHGYVDWAVRHPARFKLTFGSWSGDFAELAAAATAARSALVAAVAAAQASKDLPDGDPERLAALILAATHGAVDLALSGHLAKHGKGHADPEDLVDDLLTYLGAGRTARC
jgi:AcrR family transcriptional regulator